MCGGGSGSPRASRLAGWPRVSPTRGITARRQAPGGDITARGAGGGPEGKYLTVGKILNSEHVHTLFVNMVVHVSSYQETRKAYIYTANT